MITVDQKEIIRREYFLNRKSMRQIAKELHHGRTTIRKAIYDPGIPTYRRAAAPATHAPQTNHPPEGGSFDCGEAYVLGGGQETKVPLGFLRLDYSSHYFVC